EEERHVSDAVVEGEFVQVAGVLAEVFLEKHLVDRLDDRVQPGVLVVEKQPGMRLALGLETHAAEEQHGQTLAKVRRVLCLIAKDDRLQSEKLLIGGPA